MTTDKTFRGSQSKNKKLYCVIRLLIVILIASALYILYALHLNSCQIHSSKTRKKNGDFGNFNSLAITTTGSMFDMYEIIGIEPWCGNNE